MLHKCKNLTFQVQQNYTVMTRVGSRHTKSYLWKCYVTSHNWHVFHFLVIICAQELPVIILFIALQRNVRKLKLSLKLNAGLWAIHLKLCFIYRRWSLTYIRSSYLMLSAKILDFVDCMWCSFKDFQVDLFSLSASKTAPQ